MASTTVCSVCGSEAVYADVESKVKYCRKCTLRHIYRKVVRTMKAEKMLAPGDTVLIALSGGKDSVVLVDILGRLTRKMRGLKLLAATIDEGISAGESSYRLEALRFARKVTQEFGVPLHVFSYDSLFGGPLDAYVRLGIPEGSPCSVCGVFRRRALNMAAKALGANKIATGHNRDDEAQTILMNVLRGDLERIVRQSRGAEDLIERIKPLKRISERETAVYAYLRGYEFQTIECPYSHDTTRDTVRSLLADAEHVISGASDALLNFESKLRATSTPSVGFVRCRLCGSPTSSRRTLCKVCEYTSRFQERSALTEPGSAR
ncbi:MAG: TIGR00269 family protein [Thermoprotei archaeon]